MLKNKEAFNEKKFVNEKTQAQEKGIYPVEYTLTSRKSHIQYSRSGNKQIISYLWPCLQRT
jgi:hypothetical protein